MVIQCKYEKSKGRHYLKIYGHAGYDSEGHDIVCAAVSAIFYTLLGAVLTYSETGTEYKDESGEAEIGFKDTRKNRNFINMAMIGLGQIAMQYPEFVKII